MARLITVAAQRGPRRHEVIEQQFATLRAACAHDGDEATSPLASLPLDEMADMLGGANYLAAEGVSKAAGRHLCGTLLAGKSVDELRSALDATNDLSADEQNAALREPLHTPAAE